MKYNIHALIISLFFLFSLGKDLLEKVLTYLTTKYGDLKVLKVLLFTLLPILMIYSLLNLKEDKWLVYHFLSYACAITIYFLYNFFKKIDEFIILKSGKKINSMTLFRELKLKNLLEGNFVSFICFLKQTDLGKNKKLKWNDFDGNRFIYKKIFSLCLLCHLEPHNKAIDLKYPFYSEKLEKYFSKPDNSPLSISPDNTSKFATNDKDFGIIEKIFESCISNSIEE